MKQRTLKVVALSAGLMLGASVHADDSWVVQAGAKMWVNTWDSWMTSPAGSGVALGTRRYQIVQATHSGTEVSWVPFASVRRADWFASASAMQRTRYRAQDAGTPGGFDVQASRSELDVQVGTDVVENFSATLGYKRLTQTYGSDQYQWQGPLLGGSARANMGAVGSLYAAVAWGRMQAEFPASQTDAQGARRFRAGYQLMEVGVARAMALDGWGLRALTLSAGYRVQRVRTQGYGLAVLQPDGAMSLNTRSDLVDTTQGLALSLAGVF